MAAGTLAYGVITGICLTAAVVFVAYGLRRSEPDTTTVTFGAACFAGAGLTLTTMWLHSTSDVDSYGAVMKGPFSLSNVVLGAAFYWLITVWTGYRPPRLGFVVIAIAGGVVLAVHAMLPTGLLVDEVEQLRPVVLFGEEFAVHEPSRSPWRPLLDVYLLGLAGLAGWALFRAIRRSERAGPVVIATGLAMVLLTSLYDSLVDDGVVDTPYLTPFGLLALVLVGAVYLATTGARSERRLRAEAIDLRGVTEHQAAALDAASAQIASTAVDAERHRLARELHDSVTQRLYSAAFLAEALPRLVETDPDTSAAAADRLRSIVLSSLAELRSLLFELRPLELDAAGLDSLLRRLAENVAGSTGAAIEVVAEEGPPLPADVKLGLYRIAQEAVSNALRHSGGGSIRLVLRRTSAGGVTLVVSDDGRGFDVDLREGGHGLTGITERARLIDADLELASKPAAGATVTVAWPSTEALAGPDRGPTPAETPTVSTP